MLVVDAGIWGFIVESNLHVTTSKKIISRKYSVGTGYYLSMIFMLVVDAEMYKLLDN